MRNKYRDEYENSDDEFSEMTYDEYEKNRLDDEYDFDDLDDDDYDYDEDDPGDSDR